MVAKGEIPQDERMEEYLFKSGFPYISGPRSLEKDLAAHHYTSLYIACGGLSRFSDEAAREQKKGSSPRSEEHTSELQSLMRSSYAVFCLKTKNYQIHINYNNRVSNFYTAINTKPLNNHV